MGDSTLHPPSRGSFTPATPSGLTPNTRSEAEAALTINSIAQTDSAAPTTPLPTSKPLSTEEDQAADEATKAYRRPAGPIRTSSTNYANALAKAKEESSASSNLSTSTDTKAENIKGEATSSPTVASPVSATPFPPPGQGVVPLHTGVGSGQAEAVKRVRPTGLSLGHLGRMPSWSEQDMKHIYSSQLMREVKGDAGYDSAAEGK